MKLQNGTVVIHTNGTVAQIAAALAGVRQDLPVDFQGHYEDWDVGIQDVVVFEDRVELTPSDFYTDPVQGARLPFPRPERSAKEQAAVEAEWARIDSELARQRDDLG